MRIVVIGLALIAASAGCGCSDPDKAGTASASSTTPTTAGMETERGPALAPPAVTTPSPGGTTTPEVDALATPEYSSSLFETLEVGEVRPTQVWAWCAVSIEVGEDRYLADREIARYPGRDWRGSDFPAAWDVVVFNEAPQDGPSWAILDAKVTRTDAASLEVRHVGSDELIANFILDETPPDERILC